MSGSAAWTGLPGGEAGLVGQGQVDTDLIPSTPWEEVQPFQTTKMIAHLAARGEMAMGAVVDPVTGMATPLPASPELSPEEANARYGIPGALQFQAPVRADVAADMASAKHAELLRAYARERRPAGSWGRGILDFVTQMADPTNIVASFVPGIGEENAARLVAATGLREASPFAFAAATRAVEGATAGAAGQAAMLPLQAAYAGEQQDAFGLPEAMSSVMFGAALGGALHPALGAVGDLARGGAPDWATQPLASMRDLFTGQGPNVQAADALATNAIASVAGDRPVDQSLVVRAARRVRTAPGAGEYQAFTPMGTQVVLSPELADAGALLTSHGVDGEVNPAYPQALQPRDRGALGSRAQIAEIAGRLEPARLAPSADAGNGAPIVGPDNVVESGNGRVLALRTMYEDPKLAGRAEAYRQWLAQQGYDARGIEQPVLIGRRQNVLSDDARAAFAREANDRATLQMGDAEQARADATRAEAAMDALREGTLTGAGNAEFVRRFMAELPAEERGAMVGRDGELTVAGQRRLARAVQAAAYGDTAPATIERLLGGNVHGMTEISRGLEDAAPSWALLRRAIARGEVPAEADATPALGEALTTMDRAYQSRRPLPELLDQRDAFEAPVSRAAREMLAAFHTNADMTRVSSRARLAATLRRFAQQAMEAKAGPTLFGDTPPDAAEIMAVARARESALGGADEGAAGGPRADDETPPAATQDTLAGDAARAARQADAPDPAEARTEEAAAKAARERMMPDVERARAELEREMATLKAAEAAGELPAAAAAEMEALRAVDQETAAMGRAQEAAMQCLMRSAA